MCKEKHPFDFPNNTDLSISFNKNLTDIEVKFNFYNSKFFDWGKFDGYDKFR